MKDVSEFLKMLKKPDFSDFATVASVFENVSKNKEAREQIKKLFEQELEQEMQRDAKALFKWSSRSFLRKAFILALHLRLEGLRTTQIRRFLSMVQRARTSLRQRRGVEPEILRMRVALAHAAARHKQARPLLAVVDRALPHVTPENFEKFHDFVQAVVAYHQFLGGE